MKETYLFIYLQSELVVRSYEIADILINYFSYSHCLPLCSKTALSLLWMIAVAFCLLSLLVPLPLFSLF